MLLCFLLRSYCAQASWLPQDWQKLGNGKDLAKLDQLLWQLLSKTLLEQE